MASLCHCCLCSYVASAANIPVFGYSTTSDALANLQGAAPLSFIRTCPSDVTSATAVFQALYKLGIQYFNVMYTHDSFGRAFYEQMDSLANSKGASVMPIACALMASVPLLYRRC